MPHPDTDPLGRPDFLLGGLQVWAHSRSDDWLRVTAHCGEAGASIWVTGEILDIWSLRRWTEKVEAVLEGGMDFAALDNLEPELDWSLAKTDSLGHLVFVVEITPDHLRQRHRFEFDLDLTYLPESIRQLKVLLRKTT